MYETGERVLYGAHGICTIVATEQKCFGKQKMDYYVLQPLTQLESRYYVPMHNASALEKMRRILSKEQIESILTSENLDRSAWIPDETLRKQRYRELLAGGDRAELMRMMNTMYLHKRKQLEEGKKFHQCDENFLHDAEKVIHEEFAVVLDIQQDMVVSYIKSRLGV